MICNCGSEIENHGIISGKVEDNECTWLVYAEVQHLDGGGEDTLPCCEFCSIAYMYKFLDMKCKEMGYNKDE